MLQRFKQQLTAARQQPDYVRAALATRWILIIGVLLIIGWLFVILPLQLYVINWRHSDDQVPSADTDQIIPPNIGGILPVGTPEL